MMTKPQTSRTVQGSLLVIFALFAFQNSWACSGYKISFGGKTLLGTNHDAWFTTPHIWFENAGAGEYGAAFTGARFDGENGYAPQSGMNEAGLAFERLAAYHPEQKKDPSRKKITNPTAYLKDILHRCKSVEEVKAYISQYDHSYFTEDIFLYVDKSGKYLLVEPYSLMVGNEPTYVVANFCPSITSEKNANKLDRYRNGVAFINNRVDTTLAYCTALLDTMHVCRQKIGDGTLLSAVWDLNEGLINLFFYHDFKTRVQFNLVEELNKGDRLIAVSSLFPQNVEFEKLSTFKTPKNSALLGSFVVVSAVFFLLTAAFFLVMFIRKSVWVRHKWAQLLLFTTSLMLFFYMLVLSGSVKVYYFAAPYVHPTNWLISLSSYVPFLVVFHIFPFVVLNYRLWKHQAWSSFALALFSLHNLFCLLLIGLFGYWKFYDIF